jgi:uncharacterized membrane protein
MWKAIKYLFYNYYLFYKNKILNYTDPQFTAVLVVAGLFVLWEIIIFNITDLFDIDKNILTIQALLILAVWFYVFFHKSRWKEIIKEFENETEKQRKKRRILSVTFTITSIIIFIISFFNFAYIHNGDTPF